MNDNKTRIQRSADILKSSKESEWCVVDADNIFSFRNDSYIIGEKELEYKVYNKYDEMKDYTNETYMDKVLVIVTHDNNLKFYNQNYDEIAYIETI